MKTRNLLYILPLAALTACEPDIDEVEVSRGSADFSKMVAVGNSLTAGYQSGALDANGQINSLPAMIAGQMTQVGGGSFNQPILEGELGSKGAGFSVLLAGRGEVETRLALKGTVDCLGNRSVGPVRKGDNYAGLAALAADVSGQEYNNQGVPGAKLIDLDDPFYPNPYFTRMRTQGQSMLSLATASNATFFSLWIGNNDVLGYAAAGGDDAITIPGLLPKPELTDAGMFKTEYDAAVAALTANGAKGVVANIPDVTTIPYFTTVKWNALVLTQAQADFFNSNPLVQGYNAALDNPAIYGQFPDSTEEAASRKLIFKAGSNGFLMLDQDLTTAFTDMSGTQLPKYRLLKSGELITLTVPGDSIRCFGYGSADISDPANPVINPMRGNHVLDLDEIAKINAATEAYNNTIRTAASANGLAFVDANARLEELSTRGITVDGISFSSDFVTGGAFSLDGVHLSTRGYAFIANDFISAINATYGSSIPKVSVGSYPTIEVEQ